MLLSVVIPTFNSPPSLDRLILSLSKQKLGDHKLQIICINNAHKSFRKKLTAKWSNYFHDFKYLNSAKVGANTARNTGIRFSSGEIIWFLDDDCELISKHSYIQKIIELHQTYPEVKGIGGRYYPPAFKNKVSKAYFQITDQWLNQSKQGQYLTHNLVGGNASYKREIFDDGYRFDTHLTFGATELSLNKKLIQDGHKLALQNSLNVIHHQHLGIMKFIKRAFKQGQGKAQLCIPFHSESTIIVPNIYNKLYSFFFTLGYSKSATNIERTEFFFTEIIQSSALYRLLFSFIKFLNNIFTFLINKMNIRHKLINIFYIFRSIFYIFRNVYYKMRSGFYYVYYKFRNIFYKFNYVYYLFRNIYYLLRHIFYKLKSIYYNVFYILRKIFYKLKSIYYNVFYVLRNIFYKSKNIFYKIIGVRYKIKNALYKILSVRYFIINIFHIISNIPFKVYLILRHYTLQVIVKYHHMAIYHYQTYLVPLFKKFVRKK